jgi:hypothetical protein
MSDTPTKYIDLNVQELTLANVTDVDENPTGGEVVGPGMTIHWQNGGRAREDGSLAPANGAFVETVIYAAKQRLEFFQKSQYATDENQEAIEHLDQALLALDKRRQARKARGVEGKHEV